MIVAKRVVRARALFTGLLGSALLLAAALVGSCAPPNGDSGAREVVVYCSADDYIAKPIFDTFTRETGITVLFQGDTEATKTVGLIEKLRAEKARPRADVFWSSDAYQLAAMAGEGHFGAVDAALLEAWPEHAQDPDGRYVMFAERARVLVRNTTRVDDANAPTNIWDLTDPFWNNRVVMARPQFGTTRAHVAAMVALWGEEAAREWLTQMKANGLRLVDGNSVVVREVGAGTADIGLTDTDDAWSGRRNGWPIDLVYIDHQRRVQGFTAGEGGAMVIANAAAPIAGGPNPDEAQAFIRFLVSEQAERLLAESDSRNIPVGPGLAEEFPELNIENPLRIPIVDITSAIPVAMRLCEEIL
ncbi:MAG: extracellular solute-binding protein [Phycisphaerales bacterium]